MEGSISIIEEEIERYYILSKQKKEMEQEMKQLKNKFHQFLDESVGKERKGNINRGSYQVQRQIRSSINYHDEHTVQKLEELNLADFIEVVKRPDTEKLEAAIKLGLVEEKVFEDCKKSRLTQAIVVKEVM